MTNLQFGVYRIRHKTNNKCYIGSAAFGKGFKLRFYQHKRLLNLNKHYSSHLQRAWNKDGADIFAFEILLYCDPENCLLYEQVALDCFKPEYNSALDARNPMLGRKHSKETKYKMAQAHRGKKVSIETRKRLAEIYKQRDKPLHQGYKHSKKTKTIIKYKLQKLAANGNIGGEKHHSAKITAKEVRIIRDLYSEGNSLSILANKFKLSKTTIHRIVRKKIWKYVN